MSQAIINRRMQQRVARGRTRRAKATSRSADQSGLYLLTVAFICALFVPEAMSIHLGGLKITAAFAVLLVLMPALVVAGRIRPAWPDYVVLAVYGVFALSVALSAPMERVIEASGRSALVTLGPYLAGRYIASDFDRLRRVLTLLVTIMAVLGAATVLESLARMNIHCMFWQYGYHPHPELRFGLTRAHAWTTHPIMAGLAFALFLPLCVVAGLERVRIVGRFPWWKAVGLALGVFFSLSTGAWLPAVAAGGLIVWDYFSQMPAKLRWGLVFIGGPTMYFLLEAVANRPLLRILMMDLHLSSSEAWYYRWMLFDRVYSEMPGHWWLGHGLAIPESFAGSVGWSIDNNFLLILLKFGIIGMVAWIGLAVAVVAYGGMPLWGKSDSKAARIVRTLMYAIIGVTLTQLSVAVFSSTEMMLFLLYGLAVGAVQVVRTRSGGTARPSRKRVAASRRRAAVRRPAPAPPRAGAPQPG